MRKTLFTTGLLACALITGCGVGPRSMQRDYPRYSHAVRDIEDEHLLLNLVRMRYLESPVFLQISGITTTYGVDVDTSAGGGYTSGVGPAGTVGIGAGYSETPTITYSLPDSREFFERMIARLTTDQLAPLMMSGVGGYFWMGLKRINRLENLSFYAGWTAEVPDSYAEYKEAMILMKELERAGLIDFAFNIAGRQASSPFDELGEHTRMPDGEQIGMEFWKNDEDKWVAHFGKRAPYMRFAKTTTDDSRVTRLRELLNLDPQKYSFPIVDVDFSATEIKRLSSGEPAAVFDPEAKYGEVVIVARSMFEILGMASRSVRIPDRHLKAGLAPADEDVMGDLLTIHSSKDEPKNAAVAVKYKGVWFYTAEDDKNSKLTFMRLNSLFAVTAGRVAGTQPVLTIPVK